MSNCVYTRTEPFKCFLSLISKLRGPKKGFKRQCEIRISVARNQNLMRLQTHTALEPAVVSGLLDIHNELDCDIDVTVAARPLLNCIKALGDPAFVKVTLTDEGLLIQPAVFGGDLLSEDNYRVIETTSRHHVRFQPTQLITDYKTVVADQLQKFLLRNHQLHALERTAALAKSSKKQKNLQLKIVSAASAIYIDLFASDCCARLLFLEHDTERDIGIILNLLEFIFLEVAVREFLKLGLGPVEMSVTEQSTLLLSCQNMLCEITQRSDLVPMVEPVLTGTKRGWCTDSNQRLQLGLEEIVVKTSRAEDIAEIQVEGGQINFRQLTEYASGSFGNDAKPGNASSGAHAVVVNRYQLFPALKCFNSYEKLKIHGLLSREDLLLIKPSSNDDEFVMLAITEPASE